MVAITKHANVTVVGKRMALDLWATHLCCTDHNNGTLRIVKYALAKTKCTPLIENAMTQEEVDQTELARLVCRQIKVQLFPLH